MHSRRGLCVQEITATGNRKKKKRTALNQIGTRVRVNEMDVTLFRLGAILFATQEACQHMGGPLSLGDIEVRALDHLVRPCRMLIRTCLANLEQDVDGFACLVCPNHGWAYEILEEGTLSGRCKTRPGVVQPMYPVREGPDGKLLGAFRASFFAKSCSPFAHMTAYVAGCIIDSQSDSKRSPAQYLRTTTFDAVRPASSLLSGVGWHMWAIRSYGGVVLRTVRALCTVRMIW